MRKEMEFTVFKRHYLDEFPNKDALAQDVLMLWTREAGIMSHPGPWSRARGVDLFVRA